MPEQQRPLGDEQPDRELHRVDVGDEVVRGDEVGDGAHVVERGPGREGQPRGPDLDAVPAQQLDGARRVGGGVALVQQLERVVVHRLERGDHEQAARRGELGPDAFVAEDVLDLDRAVERQAGEALVHGAHDPERVVHAVEEVGVAVGHVPGAHRDLLADVGHDRVDVVDADAAVVDHRHGTVPAPVRAAARRLDRRHEPLLSTVHELRVHGERGEEVPGGEHVVGVMLAGRSVDPGDDRVDGISADQRLGHVGAHRRVEAVGRDRSFRPRGDRPHEPGGGVHRDRERDAVGPRGE